MSMKAKRWDEDAVNTLMSIVGNEQPVSVAKMEQAAMTLDRSVRSVQAKLRNLEITTESTAVARTSKFTDEETESLVQILQSNPGKYTYGDLAEKFSGGKFNSREIQGKVLALELTANIKPTERVEPVRTYTAEQEAKFVQMVKSGAFLEDLASAMGKEIASVRGKALSLLRNGEIDAIPPQRESRAKDTVDALTELGEKINGMTVAEIAEAIGKTERGVKTSLTRRGWVAADYDGAAKKEKAEARRAAA